MIRELWSGVFAVAGAALFSQAPSFFLQYQQALGGAIFGMSRARELTAPAGPSTLLNGEITALGAARDALATSTPWSKPVAFARHFDADIAQSTLQNYQPAVPLGAEGFIWAVVGLLAGILLASAVRAVISWPFARRRRYAR